jgi:VanZ family protein
VKKFLIYHLPVILYAALVIYISSIPNLNRPDIEILKYDKIIHFIEYAIFAILVFRSFSHIFSRQRLRLVVYSSLLFLVVFAFIDEFFQSHIPGRDSDIFDVLFDVLGGFLLIIILYIRQKKIPFEYKTN